MIDRKLFRFSITIHSDDLALISAMRGIAWQCQNEISRQTAVAGTTEPNWRRDKHQATFHFTSALNRETFLRNSERLLPKDLWKETGRSDNNPAKPASG